MKEKKIGGGDHYPWFWFSGTRTPLKSSVKLVKTKALNLTNGHLTAQDKGTVWYLANGHFNCTRQTYTGIQNKISRRDQFQTQVQQSWESIALNISAKIYKKKK